MQVEFSLNKFDKMIHEAFFYLQVHLKCFPHIPLFHAILICNSPVLLQLDLSCILQNSF